ncbi:hypothetical protein [Mycolicibacterium goodii]|uniref:hypothetical protein n=1 Tax=Mycolicibacterium goodii TaxID=134601 RepID=UPI0035578FB9
MRSGLLPRAAQPISQREHNHGADLARRAGTAGEPPPLDRDGQVRRGGASTTKSIAARGSWQSSVIRRMSVDEPMTLAETATGPDRLGPAGENPWCECGLPYRLLLPRGNAAGMESRFLVLISDAHEDGTEELATPQCGSVTFRRRKPRLARQMGNGLPPSTARSQRPTTRCSHTSMRSPTLRGATSRSVTWSGWEP